MAFREKVLVTSALPYANGPLHLGHIAGAYLPADIYVRYCRMKGKDVVYICGSDDHGVPTVVQADKEGISPKQLVDKFHASHKQDFDKLGISFDNYSQTSRPVHYSTTQEFFLRLHANGHIVKKDINQLKCTNCLRFLPDRYVEGKCPRCGAEGARGDQCEACGRWLDAAELVDPRCKICGSVPQLAETTHWFFRLSTFQNVLKEWIDSRQGWKQNVQNFCQGWFAEGLQDRAITRDIEWGIPVPLPEAKGKVFYVWFDAPIGYISSTKEWAGRKGDPDLWKDYWLNKDCKLIHFIGKDNIVFHAVVWPAFLMGHGEFNLPENIPANEFLNVYGQKFSKSRNVAVWLNEALKDFSPDPLRYCLAANAPETKDSNFTWEDFQARNNSELADIFGNFVNRTVAFTHKYFGGAVPEKDALLSEDTSMLGRCREAFEKIGALFETFQVRAATAEIMELARSGNRYFDYAQPWSTRKSDLTRCKTTIYVCFQVVRTLAVLFAPILPFSCQRLWKIIGEESNLERDTWDEARKKSVDPGRQLASTTVLFPKIEDSVIAAKVTELEARYKLY